MKFKKIMAASAAVCLATSAVAAQAQDQQIPRAGTELGEAESLGGGGALVPILALIAVILGVLAATGDGDDLPTSP